MVDTEVQALQRPLIWGQNTMAWWRRARPKSVPLEPVQRVTFSMSGWSEQTSGDEMRKWAGPHRAVLSLAAVGAGDLSASLIRNENEFRQWARELATSRRGGLIEASTAPRGMIPAVRLIYKRLEMPAYVYTGMFIFSAGGEDLVWTIVAGECDPTGVREAVVTSELIKTGKLMIEDYERTWSEDPYDATFCSVGREVLRSLSDDEEYDLKFPNHPLSRVRRALLELSDCFRILDTMPS